MAKEYIEDDHKRGMVKLAVSLSTAEHQGDIYEIIVPILIKMDLMNEQESKELYTMEEVADFLEQIYVTED